MLCISTREWLFCILFPAWNHLFSVTKRKKQTLRKTKLKNTSKRGLPAFTLSLLLKDMQQIHSLNRYYKDQLNLLLLIIVWLHLSQRILFRASLFLIVCIAIVKRHLQNYQDVYLLFINEDFYGLEISFVSETLYASVLW